MFIQTSSISSQHYLFLIEGGLRILLINLEWILIFISFELTVVFLIKIRNRKEITSVLQYEAFYSFFLGYCIGSIFTITGSYHVNSIYMSYIFVYSGYGIILIGTFFFIFLLEKRRFFYRKYFFTSLFACIGLIYLISLVISYLLATILFHILWTLFIIYFGLYFIDIAKNFYFKKGFEKFRILFFFLGAGFLFLYISYQLSLTWVVSLYGQNIRLLGVFFQLISLIVLSLCILALPDFMEYHWKEKIHALYIAKDTGLFLYEKYFNLKNDPMEKTVITGWFSMINIVLQEITKKKDILIIKKEKNTLIIYPSSQILVIVICEHYLISLKILIEKFIKEFEDIYQGVIENWNGDLSIFKPLDGLVERYFF